MKCIEKVREKEGLGRKEKSLRDSLAKERKGKKKKERMKSEGDPLPPKKSRHGGIKGSKKEKRKKGEREESECDHTAHWFLGAQRQLLFRSPARERKRDLDEV